MSLDCSSLLTGVINLRAPSLAQQDSPNALSSHGARTDSNLYIKWRADTAGKKEACNDFLPVTFSQVQY